VKVIHRARVMLSKVVDVPDDLWNRYQHPASDEEAEAASEELDALITEKGISTNAEEVEEVEDEWYDAVKGETV
jgi:hypothetical protein